MAGLLHAIVEPGFLASPPVRLALTVGSIVAVVSAVTGVFTVIRGQSFAGHALTDIGTAGGSGAFLVGIPSVYGFIAVNLAGAGVMELIGIRRARGRDLATGIVLGAALGVAALFLYLDTTSSSTTGATLNVLFGSIFTLSFSTIPVIVILAVAATTVLAILYRPLLLSSVSYDLAAARGVPVRLVGVGFLFALAVAVSLASVTIGAVLSTALLIGPPAAALRVTARTGAAIALAALVGVAATWLGILLAYDSAAWSRTGEGWPVSFCIVAVVVAFYLLSWIPGRRFHRPRRSRQQPLRSAEVR